MPKPVLSVLSIQMMIRWVSQPPASMPLATPSQYYYVKGYLFEEFPTKCVWPVFEHFITAFYHLHIFVAQIARMEDDIALLFELAEKKYGSGNWFPQEKFVDFIYNETNVIQEVDAIDLLLVEER